MKEKEIRNILIEYLKMNCSEVRIYQEKAIGGSICDLLAVTDRFVGYEIKSDADDYRRLKNQIEYYNRYFDRQYIVVGEHHLTNAEIHVPQWWGIMCISENGVREVRRAKGSTFTQRQRQLSLLWKIELKNILLKNNLPLYAQKEKSYIVDNIVAQVDGDELGRQIAYELLHRDYSVFDAVDYTEYSKKEDELPIFDMIDTLSEIDMESFTLDKWVELYSRAKSIKAEKEAVYSKKTERKPHEIPYTDIEVSLGAPWISKNIIEDFVRYIAKSKPAYSSRFVEYEAVTGAWFLHDKRYIHNANVDHKFGVESYNALCIIEATLNMRKIRIKDRDGQLDEGATVTALEKQRLICDEFKEWIWKDDDRKWQVEEEYNNMFAKYGKVHYDGKNLEFPMMDEGYELFDYQKDAVQRIIQTKNTLLAFDVGAGKTYIMIAAAMKMREMGISQKNMFVVPNNIVGQWEKIFTDLYPKAKVLTVEPKSFKPQLRKKIVEQIQQGDYDGIIIAYSCFEMIPLSSKYVTDDLNMKVRQINDAISQLSYAWGRAPLEREIMHIEHLANQLIKSARNRNCEIGFEQLGINTIFLDEAHNYKNIPIKTRLDDIRGINPKGSESCLEMLRKIRCVQEQNNGRGAVLATGTPLCNSISDAYTMQMYLQHEDMKKLHLDRFDNWVKTFAMPEENCEIDVTAAQFRFVRRFKRFNNLPELSRMFANISIFHSMEGADGRPEGVEYVDVKTESDEALKKYMKKLVERTEAIRSGMVDKSFDNMLKVSTDGRKAALDLTMVGEKQIYDNTSKVMSCVDNVMKIYTDFPDSAQLVFCDYATPQNDSFNIYQVVKDNLVKRGIREDEIAFIHSYKSESTKLKLFDNVNRAKIKVLIGSTFKLGIGANVQSKLKAIHHLDVPWRPADMVQREGRILRRGNENRDILIFRYIKKGSFDSYSWQVLENKQRFISHFLSGTTYQRSIEDLENNVLTYAEVKALALANPIMKQIAQTENEIKNLQLLVNKEAQTKRELKEKLKLIDIEIAVCEQNLRKASETERYLSRIKKEQYLNEMKKYLDKLTAEALKKEDKKLFQFICFDVCTPKNQDEEKPFAVLKYWGMEYKVEMGDSPAGNMRRIANFLKSFRKVGEKFRAEKNTLTVKRQEAEKAIKIGSNYTMLLKDTKSDLEKLMEMARMQQLVE